MSLEVPHSAFWDCQSDFSLPFLKYSCTSHAKFGVSKPVIINDNYMVKSFFTFVNKSAVSPRLPMSKICILYCILYLNDQFWHTYLHI